MEIVDFMPKYPYLFHEDEVLLNPYSSNFNDVIVSKKEFADLSLDPVESIEKGEKFKHQTLISRFLSSETPYNELLLFHEMGTGKTCTVIETIEKLKENTSMKGALILAKGDGIIKNFKNELIFTCTDGRYKPVNSNELTEREFAIRSNKLIESFYVFSTFAVFASTLAKMSDIEIVNQFSHFIIVMDEVHNIRDKDSKKTSVDVFKQFHRMFHLIKNAKIVLMSGTVMKDAPFEFASIMNLILPLELQFSTEKEFMKEYFINGVFNTDKIEDFKTRIKGRVSYLKSMISKVPKVFIGQKLGSLNHFTVFPDYMSEFQEKSYQHAYSLDSLQKEKSFFSKSRQAILFVFPDGTYGKEGFNQSRFFNVKKKPTKTKGKFSIYYTLGSDLVNAIDKNLDKLAQYSSKFANTIKTILDSQPSKSLVYCEFVNGSGSILFSKILEQFGFEEFKKPTTEKKLRYILLTQKTTSYRNLHRLINHFNSKKNDKGEIISVIIGSRVIGEGLTFKNITHEFILTPHWNYSETVQVIARGWRVNSHTVNPKPKNIKIYQQVSICSGSTPSIDLQMYEIAEHKDVLMKQIERVVKEAAFDCPLFFKRNHITGYDGMRECEYTACEYTCDGKQTDIDSITYNLFFLNLEQVYKFLFEYFRTHFFIPISDLVQKCQSLTQTEVIQGILSIIDQDRPFKDKFGRLSRMKIGSSFLFITSSHFKGESNLFSEFYYKQLFIQNGNSFERIMDALLHKQIPKIIRSVFQEPGSFRKTVSNLPEIVQRKLLEICVQAENDKKKKNVQVREEILIFYKGFYTELNRSHFVWLFKEKFGVSELVSSNWVQISDETQINQYLNKKKQRLNNSRIGFYGLYNPYLDDFCLKKVSEKETFDLRKLAVGRRCVDWDQPTLIDIVVEKIKLPIPDDKQHFFNNNTQAEIIQSAKKKKYYSVLKEPISFDKIKRFVFWGHQTRQVLCETIHDWLNSNDLVEQNFNCGHQRKKRDV